MPCFTLRANTERPITVGLGTNIVLGLDPARIIEIPRVLSERSSNSRGVPAGWDGHAADRIVAVLDALPDQAGC